MTTREEVKTLYAAKEFASTEADKAMHQAAVARAKSVSVDDIIDADSAKHVALSAYIKADEAYIAALRPMEDA